VRVAGAPYGIMNSVPEDSADESLSGKKAFETERHKKRYGGKFFRSGLFLLAGAAVLMNLPVLAGYVPIPAEIVLFFPPWDGLFQGCCESVHHAEMGDLMTQVYPWRTALNSALSLRHVPLWNFQYLMGAPYEAMPQSALFFPLNWLYAIFSAPLAWSLLFIIRPALTAVSTAIFVRRLGASNAAALISGLTFGLSGSIMTWGGWALADSAMWLPFLFLSVHWLRDRPSAASIALAAAAFTLPVLGGQPEVAFQMTVLATLYAACRAFPWTSRSPRYLAAFAVAGLLALCLAAVQLLPAWEWIHLIPRSLAFRFRHIPTSKIIAFLSRDIFSPSNVDGITVPERFAYVGFFAVAALPFAWLWRSRRDVLYFAAILFFCLSMVYGWEPVYSLSKYVPILSGLPNWRFIIGADFAVVVLAGLAISALESRCVRKESESKPALLIGALLTGAAACALMVARATGHTAIPYYLTAVLLIPALALILLAKAGKLQVSSFVLCAAVLVTADIFTFGYGRLPFYKPETIFPANATFDFLRQHAGAAWRVGSVDLTYGSNFELPYGLSEASGYDFATDRVARFMGAFSSDRTGFRLESDHLIAAPKGALALTGVRYFITTAATNGASRLAATPSRFRKVMEGGMTQVFENLDAMPIAFFVPGDGIDVVGNDDAQYRAVQAPDFDPRRGVITPNPVAHFSGVRASASSSTVESVSRGLNEMRFTAAADRDGLLVFDETYYPGWVAEVDGSPAPLIRADYAFMAVPIAQGRHDVRFRFAPPLVRTGGWMSAIAALLVVIILVVRARDVRDLFTDEPSY
jgi:hypothetical protein